MTGDAEKVESGRSKRRKRQPKRFDDEDELYNTARPPAPGSSGSQQAAPKQDEFVLVRRPVTPKDIRSAMANSVVHLFWPGDSTWYEAKVEKIRVKDRVATVHYIVSDETEDVDLNEVMKAKEITMVESRKKPVKLGKGETLVLENDASEQEEARSASPDTSNAPDTQNDEEPMQVDAASPPAPAAMATSEDCGPPKQEKAESPPAETEAQADQPGPPSKKQRIEAGMQDAQGCEAPKPDSVAKQGEGAPPSEQVLSAEEWSRSMLANLGVPQDNCDSVPDSSARSSDPGTHQGAEAGDRDLLRQTSLTAATTADSVRSKVAASLAESLAKAVAEGDGSGDRSQHVTSLAEVIEEQLFELHGGVGKEYRAKYRSLHFNLKDPQNPSLRSRVLAGEIPPNELVRMTPNELASKELSEWRSMKAAEFEKAVIVDEETAAKYSTAAAAKLQQRLRKSGKVEVVGYSSTVSEETPAFASSQPTEAPDVPGHDLQEAGAGTGEGHAGGEGDKDGKDAPAAHETKVAGLFDTPKAEITPGKGTHVSVAAEEPQSAEADDLSRSPEFEPAPLDDAPSDDEPALSPSRRGPSLSPCLSDTPEPETEVLHGVLESASSSVELGSTVWEGDLSVPGLGEFPVGVEQIGGMGDIGYLFSAGSVEIKGRVGNDKLEPFFSDLCSSRSRTVTLGIARCVSGHDHEMMTELVKQFMSKNRSGVGEPGEGVEVYFVPRGNLAARFCKTAKHSLRAEDRRVVPSNVGFGELLCITVHRKDWAPPDRQPRRRVLSATRSPEAAKADSASEDFSPPPDHDDDHEFSPPPDSPPASKSQDGGHPAGHSGDAVALPSFLAPLLAATADNANRGDPRGVPTEPDRNPQNAGMPSTQLPGLDLGNLGALAAALGVNLPASTAGSDAPQSNGSDNADVQRDKTGQGMHTANVASNPTGHGPLPHGPLMHAPPRQDPGSSGEMKMNINFQYHGPHPTPWTQPQQDGQNMPHAPSIGQNNMMHNNPGHPPPGNWSYQQPNGASSEMAEAPGIAPGMPVHPQGTPGLGPGPQPVHHPAPPPQLYTGAHPQQGMPGAARGGMMPQYGRGGAGRGSDAMEGPGHAHHSGWGWGRGRTS